MTRIFRTLALAAALAGMTATAALAVPHAGDVAPAFALPEAGGGTISLAALKGKPVYLNFFASWCGPCNEEAPAVNELYKKYHPRGLAIVGINELENESKAEAFAQKYRWPFAVAVDGGDTGKDYGVVGLPVHVFIDRNGKVSTLRLGEMQTGEIEDAIKKIL